MVASSSGVLTSARCVTFIAGILLATAVIQFWIVEAVAAGAWMNPPYRYSYNFVSDLAVTSERIVFDGRVVASPLHALMNSSFTALGSLVLISSALMFISRERGYGRRAVLAVGLIFAIGSWLVAAFPEDTIQVAHIVGAFANIVGGNALVIVLGREVFRESRRAVAYSLMTLGIFGLIATVFLVAVPGFFNGAVERAAAYPYMVAFLVAAIGLMADGRGCRLPPSRARIPFTRSG
jgi:hypothetical membrane protein